MKTKEEALSQYEYETILFEQYGSKSIISFEEWLEIKNIMLVGEEVTNEH